jgi:hypothetical protein
MFVRMLLGNQVADEREGIAGRLQAQADNAYHLLGVSPLIGMHDLETDEGFTAALEVLKDKHDTLEWFALVKGVSAQMAGEAIEKGDAQGAAYEAQRAMFAHAILVFERDLKPLIWRGYGDVGADQVGDALDLWEANKDNKDEAFWQVALAARPFLLNQLLAAPVVIHGEKAFVGGKSVSNTGGKYPDFLLRQQDLGNVVVVEIKTPVAKLLQGKPYRSGVYAPSAELAGGLSQIAVQRHKLVTNAPVLAQEQQDTDGDEEPFRVFNPRGILVIGSAERELDTGSKRQSFELFRSGLRDVDVVTYDELFTRARVLREVLTGA